MGTMIVVREDGSTDRIQAQQLTDWGYAGGAWQQLNAHDCPAREYCTLRFPGEEWPPRFQ